MAGFASAPEIGKQANYPETVNYLLTTNPNSRVAVKNRISGLNAIRCSSVLINVNSYTQGEEINNANTDWFQAVIWKRANLEEPAAVRNKQSEYELAVHYCCAPKTCYPGQD